MKLVDHGGEQRIPLILQGKSGVWLSLSLSLLEARELGFLSRLPGSHWVMLHLRDESFPVLGKPIGKPGTPEGSSSKNSIKCWPLGENRHQSWGGANRNRKELKEIWEEP